MCFVLSFFPRDVLDEILDFIESVSEDLPTYSSDSLMVNLFGETGIWSDTGHPIRARHIQ